MNKEFAMGFFESPVRLTRLRSLFVSVI